MKRCSICGEEKPLTKFYKHEDMRDRLRPSCKKCVCEGLRDSMYGLDKGQYQGMLAKQNGCCAICGQPMKPANIDHDHATKQIRGLLCRWCNLGLGNFKDSETALVAAAEYLRKSKEQT